MTVSHQPTASPWNDRIRGVDRLHSARRLLIAVLLLTAACLTTIAVDGRLRVDVPHAADLALFRTLGLHYPALVPSGRVLRHPEFARAGVDLRYTPAMIQPGADPALFILPHVGISFGHDITTE